MRKYNDLIDQTFAFPTPEFSVKGNYLSFNGINLIDIIKEYGTPLRLTYLPKISEKVQLAKSWFDNSIKKHKYKSFLKKWFGLVYYHFGSIQFLLFDVFR